MWALSRMLWLTIKPVHLPAVDLVGDDILARQLVLQLAPVNPDIRARYQSYSVESADGKKSVQLPRKCTHSAFHELGNVSGAGKQSAGLTSFKFLTHTLSTELR